MSDEELADVLGVIEESGLDAADKGTLTRYFQLTTKRAEQMRPCELAEAREFAGLTLAQAALLLGVSRGVLTDIESGAGGGVGCWPPGLLARLDKVYGLGERPASKGQ